MKCSLGISSFLEEISSLSHSVLFLYFFALIAEEGFISSCYSLEQLKKIEKTTRPFGYDLNQIPYDYTVKVRNRFQGLDWESAWWTMDRGSWHCTGDRDQDHLQEKEMQKSKMAVWGGLTNSMKRREVKSKGEKENTHLNAEFQRIARRDFKKSVPQWSMQRNRGKQQNRKD